MHKVELLSPAGNFACLKAAIDNGANAVYLGGKNFSARAFANNFDNDELLAAVKYAHLRNVKIYVTVNTLLTDNELKNALKQIEFCYYNNVDALIIQDLGLYYAIKQKFPDFELHCSTQMHIHNISGIKVAKKLGFKRVVIARESSLDFIKEACKQDIEIETFVHGAICVSYSGECLMSSATKGRSANKGMCAQCCRLKYELFDPKHQKISTDTDYLLSPKDMMLVNDVDKLIDAGVTSFKIEGRLKSAAYVGYVTSLYRKAIDAYYNNETFNLSDEMLNKVKVLFNRNFTNDYLFNKNDLFGQNTPNHLGVIIGKVIKNFNKQTFIKLSSDINQFDGIRIGEYGCILNRIYKNGLLVNGALKGEVISIDTEYKVEGPVFKTLDAKLEESINNISSLHIPLNLKIKIVPDEKIEICCDDYNFVYTSSIYPLRALNKPLNNEDIFKQFAKLNESEYFLNNLEVITYNAFLPVSKLNEVRRDFIVKLNEYRLTSFKRELIKSDIKIRDISSNFDEDDLLEDNNAINGIPINYVINPLSIYENGKSAVICEIGGLLHEYEEKIAYYTLNCFNSYAYEFLIKIGFTKIILSSELNEFQINELINEFKNRNSINIKPYVFMNGARSLMYLKANPFEKYIDEMNNYYLSDGTNDYQLNRINNVIEIKQIFHNEINNKQVLTFNKK